MRLLLAFAPASLSAALVFCAGTVPATANIRVASAFHRVDSAQLRREPGLAAYLREAGLSTVMGSSGLSAHVSRTAIANSGVSSFSVNPSISDSPDTDTAQASWVAHIGCPSRASQVAVTGSTVTHTTLVDNACSTADSNDSGIYGFLMSKVGSSYNQSSARGTYSGLPSRFVLSYLGFDIRTGSHCGAYPELVVTDSVGDSFTANCQSLTVQQTDAGQADPLFPNTSFATNGQWTRLVTPFYLPFEVSHIAVIQASGADGDCLFVQPNVPAPNNISNCSDGSGIDILDNFMINGRFRGKP